MSVTVHFYSYFKELAGCAETELQLPEGCTIREAIERVSNLFPKLGGIAIRNSVLAAVGVEYQDRGYVLKPGDELSLFPPVQGG
jgi:molybdopterin converting factor small subunit